MMPSAHICPSEGHVCICHCDGAHTSVCAAPVAVLALLPCGQPSLFRVLLAPPREGCVHHTECVVWGENGRSFSLTSSYLCMVPMRGASFSPACVSLCPSCLSLSPAEAQKGLRGMKGVGAHSRLLRRDIWLVGWARLCSTG